MARKRIRRVVYDEGKTVCKTYMRKMPDNKKKRQSYGYLRKPQAQAKTGLKTA